MLTEFQWSPTASDQEIKPLPHPESFSGCVFATSETLYVVGDLIRIVMLICNALILEGVSVCCLTTQYHYYPSLQLCKTIRSTSQGSYYTIQLSLS